MSQIPHKDIEMAQEQGLFFKVAAKGGRGQKWQYVGDGTHSLEVAVARAREMSGYESAVFLAAKNGGGYLYWSSLSPELFNSTVIELAASL